ncbi:MAG: transposase [Bacteroidota bacterium]
MKTRKTYYHRHLPHYHPEDATFHIVFRLAGTLPQEVVERLRTEREHQEETLAGIRDERRKRDEWHLHHQAYFEKVDSLLDNDSSGPRWLADERIAAIVAEAFHHRDEKEYDLLAFTIMPNHVHLVATVGRPDWSTYNRRHESSTALSDILENLKWYTALKCNRVLTRAGQFWQHESYDHVIRDSEELERAIGYVLNNPVKAGLVDTWEQWRWTYMKLGIV